MRHSKILLVAIACFGCASAVASDEAPLALPAMPTDFTAYRNEWGARSDYSELCEHGRPDRAIGDAAAVFHWEEIVRVSGPWLVQCPVDVHVHMWRAVAMGELGRASEQAIHEAWARGLLDSIFSNGDGETPATAYVTISIAEEYAAIEAMGRTIVSQALKSDPAVDALTVKDADGNQSTIYFNPSAHFLRLIKLLDGLE